ncbi:MAG TPA: hypothetical protein VGI39_28695 [Polyangiaceae bacterium]|jgi:hypothetical protein
MLQLLTTDEFAGWFAKLEDAAAEDVATAIDVVEQLGPEQAPPESTESLLWYEHPSLQAKKFREHDFVKELHAWGAFHDYAFKVVQKLESPRFVSRLERLGNKQAEEVLECLRQIKQVANPRARWTSKAATSPLSALREQAKDRRAEIRRLYFAALEAAGFRVEDVPAHSRALRELSRVDANAPFRLLYGVDVEHEIALFVLGEPLDRAFYGDSVRRAEKLWRQFLEGTLPAVEPVQLR